MMDFKGPAQKVLAMDTLDEVILSPYAHVRALGDGAVRMRGGGSSRSVVLRASEDATISRLLEELRRGVPEEQLIELLSSLGAKDPENWIGMLRRAGVVE